MKRLAIIAAMAFVAVGAQAEIAVATTNYFTNATFVATTEAWTNNFTGNAIVLDVAELGDLTDAQSSNDVRAVMYNVLTYLHTQIQALASTNRPVNMVVSERTTNDGSGVGDIVTTHQVKTKRTISTFAFPAE